MTVKLTDFRVNAVGVTATGFYTQTFTAAQLKAAPGGVVNYSGAGGSPALGVPLVDLSLAGPVVAYDISYICTGAGTSPEFYSGIIAISGSTYVYTELDIDGFTGATQPNFGILVFNVPVNVAGVAITPTHLGVDLYTFGDPIADIDNAATFRLSYRLAPIV